MILFKLFLQGSSIVQVLPTTSSCQRCTCESGLFWIHHHHS
ncbi:unnamed protein product, partial [Haemonchus placei]|uniref:Uncharacterized protein n=1 Tax=Haemonchus placei TaxID=6290 RepID=A0A0N4VWR7_HAEPC